MFTHMVPVGRETHHARDTAYELLVYRVAETDEYRIYVSKNGFGVGDIYTASQDVAAAAKHTSGEDLVAGLIAVAKDDIDRNEFGMY